MTRPKSCPFSTWSPSLAKNSTSHASSNNSKVRSNICNPQIIPSSLQIKSTTPVLEKGITLFVETSSLVISSFKAVIISGSTFNFKVV